MPEERILIVGGDESARGILAHALGGQGRRLRQADDPTGALRMVDSFMPHLLIADADLPDLGGLDLIERLLRRTPDADAMLMSGGADIRTILRAKEIGALDVLRKPLDHKDIRDRVARGFMSRRIRERCHPTYPTSATDQEPRLIGRSAQMLEVRRQIADFASTNATVLIVGPTGTGKELVARSIHEYSERRNHPFVTVNCAAVNASLTESELFGHAKGAFTGAARDHGGRFEQASGGTILLDEIGDATLEFQAKLLRVLQDGTFDRIGGETELTTNARVIAATNQDLDALTEKGGFRSDLLHRLAVAVIRIPSLREHIDDLGALVGHLLARIALRNGHTTIPILSDDAKECMRHHDWPGNVRELEGCLERGVLRTKDGVIYREDLRIGESLASFGVTASAESPKIAAESGSSDPDTSGARFNQPDGRLMTLEQAQVMHIKEALQRTAGNVNAAARMLGVARSTLRSRMERLGL